MRAYSSISAKKPSCTVSHIMVTSLGSKWAAGKGSVSAGRRIGVSASQETPFRNVWHGPITPILYTNGSTLTETKAFHSPLVAIWLASHTE